MYMRSVARHGASEPLVAPPSWLRSSLHTPRITVSRDLASTPSVEGEGSAISLARVTPESSGRRASLEAEGGQARRADRRRAGK